jgi:hypothetical protein
MSHIEARLGGDSWAEVADRLSCGRDLTEWARSFGAIARSRKIKDGQSLLRLALAYGGCGKSLKQTCLWAADQGIADLSDEALLKRLAKAGDWLGDIVETMLGGTGAGVAVPELARPLRLVDGTTVSAPGATQPTWRLIVTFDPARQTTIGLDLSPAKVGEGLGRAALGHGDLVVGDRGFARPEGLASVRQQGADFLVRLGSRSLRLLAPDDSRVLDRQALLDQATVEGRLDQPVLIGHSRHRNWDPVPARLIVLPLPADAAAANACKLTRAGQREGYQPSTLAEQASGWLIFLTSLDAAEFTAETVAAIYRLRWQIELVIKKFKSLGHLDKLPAHSPGLAKAWLHANLLVSLLVEDLSTQVPDSPPSES